MGLAAKLAIPTPEHYLPLVYALGFAYADEAVETIYKGLEYGSISMRCVRFG